MKTGTSLEVPLFQEWRKSVGLVFGGDGEMQGSARDMATKGLVTWQDAEEALLAAVEYLGMLPDRERGFLSAGSRSCWPQIIRSVRDGDYGEGQGFGGEAAPRRQLSRKEATLLDKVLLDPGAAALAIPEGQRRLVGRVLVAKLDGRGEGFNWSRIWESEGGFGSGTTTEALRKRYERAVTKVAMKLERMGMAA